MENDDAGCLFVSLVRATTQLSSPGWKVNVRVITGNYGDGSELSKPDKKRRESYRTPGRSESPSRRYKRTISARDVYLRNPRPDYRTRVCRRNSRRFVTVVGYSVPFRARNWTKTTARARKPL